jgi:hypothetical protein
MQGSGWIASIGLDSKLFGTHSLRRTKPTLIYRRTGNLRAVQLLLETATYCPRTPGRRTDLLLFHPRCGEAVLIARRLEFNLTESGD